MFLKLQIKLIPEPKFGLNEVVLADMKWPSSKVTLKMPTSYVKLTNLVKIDKTDSLRLPICSLVGGEEETLRF